ncbi:hypothetical protein SAMN05421659_11360 [[Clostridium] fimetarium]|uniref:Uncharacterized protein n=1 Tax=[Clostridium] fimetarium TaxID=99656 RepID=A0A1I0RA21_9FIRM|nr:hypothetical protein SAMN05421659_11360 [[Clostridium] fimetarium]
MNKLMYKMNGFTKFLYILVYCKRFKITYNLNIELENNSTKTLKGEILLTSFFI